MVFETSKDSAPPVDTAKLEKAELKTAMEQQKIGEEVLDNPIKTLDAENKETRKSVANRAKNIPDYSEKAENAKDIKISVNKATKNAYDDIENLSLKEKHNHYKDDYYDVVRSFTVTTASKVKA